MEAIHPFGASNPWVRTNVVAIEVRVVAIHAHPTITADGNPNRVDPDRWRPLLMSFREFYGLGDRVDGPKLAEIDEELWRPKPLDRSD